MTMTHILLTLAYEGTALISAMPVWALLIIFIDVDIEGDPKMLINVKDKFFCCRNLNMSSIGRWNI